LIKVIFNLKGVYILKTYFSVNKKNGGH